MGTVTVAAAALDTAISTLHTTLAAYVNACGAANATYRQATPNQSKHSLDNCCQQARAAILADVTTSIVLADDLQSPVPPSLASQHSLD
jgi:hypothetical protein